MIQKEIDQLIEERLDNGIPDELEQLLPEESKGVCKACGCTWNKACYNSEHGACWWIDEIETLCSHCYYSWGTWRAY